MSANFSHKPPTRLPHFHEVTSSYSDADWIPDERSVVALVNRLGELVPKQHVDHARECALHAAIYYVTAMQRLSDSPKDHEPSERRSEIKASLEEMRRNLAQVNESLMALGRIFPFGLHMADRAYSYLLMIDPEFFEPFHGDPFAKDYVNAIPAIIQWTAQRLPSVDTAIEGLSRPGEKESNPMHGLAVVAGIEWRHLRREHGAKGTLAKFMEAVRLLLAENCVSVGTLEQLLEANKNYGRKQRRVG